MFKATPHNGARRFGQCFDPSESMENTGILDVFPIFMLHDWGQKIRRSPQLPLCGVALIQEAFFSELLLDKIQQLLRWSGDGVVVAVIGQNLQGVIF